MKNVYEVEVGNIGHVHDGSNLRDARKVFRHYVGLSKLNVGRAAGEYVALMKNGDVIEGWEGANYVE